MRENRQNKILATRKTGWLPSRALEENEGIPNTAPTVSLFFDATRPVEVDAATWARLTEQTKIIVSWNPDLEEGASHG